MILQEDSSFSPEPNPGRRPIPTTDDDWRACTLLGNGLAHLVNIMRIGQHQGRPAHYEDLDERTQAEVRLWARSRPAEGYYPVACEAKAFCVKLIEEFES